MIRRILAATIALALVVVTMPVPVQAAAARQATGQIGGTGRNAQGQNLANYTVRLRNVKTGELVATTTTNASGGFLFTGLNAGDYVVEIVNPQGAIVATSATITLTTGAMTVSGLIVTASAAGALGAAGAAGGGSFFGTTAGIVTVLAVAGGVAGGIYAGTRPAASPSR